MRANFYMSISADTHTHTVHFLLLHERPMIHSHTAIYGIIYMWNKNYMNTFIHNILLWITIYLLAYIVVVHFTISSYTKFTHSDRIFIFHPLGKWAYGFFFFVFLNYSFAQIFCCAKDETRARNCNLLGCASDSLWGSRRVYDMEACAWWTQLFFSS